MMTTDDLAELDIMRNIPNEVLTPQGILEYFDGMYLAYEDRCGGTADLPDILINLGDTLYVELERLLDSSDKYRIKNVEFRETNTYGRVCYINAEHAD